MASVAGSLSEVGLTRPQIRQDGEHAAVVLDGGREVQFREDRGDVLLHGALGDDQGLGDRRVGAALRHQAEHLALTRGQALEGVFTATPAEQERDDLRVQRRAATGDAAHRVGEGVHVRHAVLEQVARGLRGLRQQVERVGLLDVLAEHEHARAGVLRADLAGRAQPLVGVAGRHADVDDRDVGLVGADLAEQVLGVAGLAGDLEAGVLEQPDETLAQQHGVLGHDDLEWGICGAHTGISARRVVPDPGGESSAREPSSAPTRSARPRNPDPRPGSAPPTPSSRISTHAWPLILRTATVAALAWAYLATLVRASAMTKYAAASTGSGSRSPGTSTTLTGSGERTASAS